MTTNHQTPFDEVELREEFNVVISEASETDWLEGGVEDAFIDLVKNYAKQAMLRQRAYDHRESAKEREAGATAMLELIANQSGWEDSYDHFARQMGLPIKFGHSCERCLKAESAIKTQGGKDDH